MSINYGIVKNDAQCIAGTLSHIRCGRNLLFLVYRVVPKMLQNYWQPDSDPGSTEAAPTDLLAPNQPGKGKGGKERKEWRKNERETDARNMNKNKK